MKIPWAKKKKSEAARKPSLMRGQDDYVFRRSRTITGTKADNVAVPASSRGQFKTDRIKSIELRKHRRKIANVLVLLLALLGFVTFLVVDFVSTPTIALAQLGVNTPQLQDYQKSISDYFGVHPFERFSFLLNEDNLQTAIMGDHSEIESADVVRNWYGGSSVFDLYFRTPILVWKTDVKKYYVDSNGITFDYNYFAEPTLEVTDQSGITLEQNEVVASASFIRFLGQIVTAVNGYSYGKVVAIIVPSATREADLKLDGREYLIKTSTDRDPLQEAEDIANALDYFDKKAIVPQYVDVRVAHKAYYK